MKEKWVVTAKRADFGAISRTFGITPVLARLMVNRDVNSEEMMRKYLWGDERDLYDPSTMKDILKARDLIMETVETGESIAVASDFDVDGIMSGFILHKGFTRIGGRCKIYTPDRVAEGYGLNMRIVDEALDDGCGVIVTCDNGIAAFEAVEYARAKGLKVIVTDHHDIPFEEDENGRHPLYVPANAIVNPKQADCAYPFKKLCGAGVAFKLLCLLYDAYDIPEDEKFGLMEYTAIATVADVMDLQDENRIMVKKGLKMLAHTKNEGLKALIQVCQLNPSKISAYHIGFVLGPCFNAAGRLDTVKIALDLLMETDPAEAAKKASALKELNESRKNLTVKGFEQAVEKIENSGIKEDKVILVKLENCHESLVGIIAGRIKEKYHRPTLVFTDVGDGRIKGSGRSIEAYNMFEELTVQKPLLERFGGHPMAAGLTLKAENLEPLRMALNTQTTLTAQDLIPVVRIDVPMPVGYITKEFVKELELLEPFGKGNVKPVFAEKYFSVLRARVLGKNKNVLKLQVMNDDKKVMDAIYFGDIPAFETFIESEFGVCEKEKMFNGEKNNVTIALTYYPDLNEYMGVESIQIVVTGYCRILRK